MKHSTFQLLITLVMGATCALVLASLFYLGLAAELPLFGYFVVLPMLALVTLTAFLLISRRLLAEPSPYGPMAPGSSERLIEQELWR